MEAIIRKATISDADNLAYVHYHSWQTTYKGLINAQYLANRSIEQSISIFTEHCENTYCAIIENQIIGFASLGYEINQDINNKLALIYGLYLLKEFQHLGIGFALMNHIVSIVKQQVYTSIGLWVLDSNQNAIRFYTKCGFIYTGHSKDVILGSKVTELFYQKDLT